MAKMLHQSPTVVKCGVKGSIKNHQKIEERGGGIIHPILLTPRIRRQKHLNLIANQTLIYHHHHPISVHQVMIKGRREKDPRETEVNMEKRGIENETKNARGVIRDQSINQKGWINIIFDSILLLVQFSFTSQIKSFSLQSKGAITGEDLQIFRCIIIILILVLY